MYHNHHDDHRYDDRDDQGARSYEQYRSDEYTNQQYESDYRYQEIHSEERYTADQHRDIDLSDEQYPANYDSTEFVTEPYDHEDEIILINEPIDDEFLREDSYLEDRYIEKHAVEERYAEERYMEGRHVEKSYTKEHYVEDHYASESDGVDSFQQSELHDGNSRNEVLYSDNYYADTLRDPQIYEYSHESSGALSAADFHDTQRGGKNQFALAAGKIGARLAIALFTIGFAAVTIIASKPQMTPEEIVQMEGYKGPARDRTLFFNLASLRECGDINDCDGVVKANTETNQPKTGSTDKTAFRTGSADSDTMNYREIPAVAARQTNSDAGNSFAGTWTVKEQWSNVRETPDISGAIVTSLAAERRVTIVNRVGDWYEISTEDAASKPLGFIHSSLLQRI